MEPIKHSEAEAHGFTPYLLRSSRHFVHPVDGVAQLASSADDLAATCRAVAKVLPSDAVFTHLTSVRLRGWWLPLLDDLPLIACTGGESPHHDRRGVYIRRCSIPPDHRDEILGVAMASPEWTIIELAEHLALLDLVDGRSESWWESMLRLLHVLSGVEVEPQHVVHNAAGVEVARVDLWIVGTNRIPEYDGSEHRGRARHEKDLRRDKVLARQGLERYGYIATELINTPARVISDAEDALGWPHLAGRVEIWRAQARLASISPAGKFALKRRLERFVRDASPRSKRASGANQPPNGAHLDDTPSQNL